MQRLDGITARCFILSNFQSHLRRCGAKLKRVPRGCFSLFNPRQRFSWFNSLHPADFSFRVLTKVEGDTFIRRTLSPCFLIPPTSNCNLFFSFCPAQVSDRRIFEQMKGKYLTLDQWALSPSRRRMEIATRNGMLDECKWCPTGR